MKKSASFLAILSSASMPTAMQLAAGAIAVSAVALPTEAKAARCSVAANGSYQCLMFAATQTYKSNNLLGSCTGANATRKFYYQVPEGIAPPGGWPVAFYYHGTMNAPSAYPADGPATYGPRNPASDPYGMRYEAEIFHELLDDPAGTGKKYAVIAAFAPDQGAGLLFWDTNKLFPYNLGNDYCFLPKLWNSISTGSYGPGSQYNMDRRFAFGLSSGGYNTSRMAVSWNGTNAWKALGIVAASYATCSGVNCSIPATLPANHPPTKFWHGTGDTTVPIYTMEAYHNRLVGQGLTAEKNVNAGPHAIGPDAVGSTGIKEYFDRYY